MKKYISLSAKGDKVLQRLRPGPRGAEDGMPGAEVIVTGRQRCAAA